MTAQITSEFEEILGKALKRQLESLGLQTVIEDNKRLTKRVALLASDLKECRSTCFMFDKAMNSKSREWKKFEEKGVQVNIDGCPDAAHPRVDPKEGLHKPLDAVPESVLKVVSKDVNPVISNGHLAKERAQEKGEVEEEKGEESQSDDDIQVLEKEATPRKRLKPSNGLSESPIRFLKTTTASPVFCSSSAFVSTLRSPSPFSTSTARPSSCSSISSASFASLLTSRPPSFSSSSYSSAQQPGSLLAISLDERKRKALSNLKPSTALSSSSPSPCPSTSSMPSPFPPSFGSTSSEILLD